MLTANAQDRTITAAPLLPFGEPGRTNKGRVTVSAGTLTMPDPSSVVMNLEHVPTAPVARCLSLVEQPDGIHATFRVAATSAGDDLLTEVAEGLRTGVSVEIADPVIRAGVLLGGTLTGAAAVVTPAFPSAQLVAADAGDAEDEQDEQDPTDTAEPTGSTDEADEAETHEETVTMAETTETSSAEATETEPLTASIPTSLHARASNRARTLFATLAATPPADRSRLLAALDQAISTDLLPSKQVAWLGEVYGSRTYVRRFASLAQHGDLAGLKATGWRFEPGKTPQVAPYAGFPNQPNSNEVKTQAVTLDAARLAGGGAVDRAFLDFPTPEFWAGYYREASNDYERRLDAIVRDAMIAGATPVVSTLASVPAGVSEAAAKIVDGALAIIAAERDVPAFAVVGQALYRGLLLTRADDVVAFLTAAMGLEDGQLAGFKIVPSSVPTLTGKVLVGTKTAATLYELPGASPIRVDSVNIGTGGVETGVYGYHAELINDATGLALVASA